MFPCNVSGNIIQELLVEPTMSCEDQNRNTVDNFVSGMQKRKRGRPRKIVVEQSLNNGQSSSSTTVSVEKGFVAFIHSYFGFKLTDSKLCFITTQIY